MIRKTLSYFYCTPTLSRAYAINYISAIQYYERKTRHAAAVKHAGTDLI